MFVQATKSRKNGKTYTSHLVRESFRTPNGPRSRTIANISKLPPELRQIIAAHLSGKATLQADSIVRGKGQSRVLSLFVLKII